jgi:hypothetical protein
MGLTDEIAQPLKMHITPVLSATFIYAEMPLLKTTK